MGNSEIKSRRNTNDWCVANIVATTGIELEKIPCDKLYVIPTPVMRNFDGNKSALKKAAEKKKEAIPY